MQRDTETSGGGLVDKVRALPQEPGVYLWKDAKGKVLYVGKANSLRDRVRSYLADPDDLPPKTRVLMSRARDLDYIAVQNEVEALVLECNLIKEYRPRYNIRLRDDKKYPYVRITTDPFPRVFATRTVVHDGSEYFGPYSDVGAMRRTLALLQRVFPTRPCTPESLDGIDRPCLYYDIKMCGAPCVGLQSRADYLETVEAVRLFLRGRTDELVTSLEARMQAHSDQQEYEQAARVRDQIEAIERSTDRLRSPVGESVERDAVALRRDGPSACGIVLRIRGGRLLASETFYFAEREESTQEIFTAFLQQYYNAIAAVPAEILTSEEPEDLPLLGRWLGEKRGGPVAVGPPADPEREGVVRLALKNASLKLDEWIIARGGAGRRAPEEVVELGSALGMRELPRRIECFDISNLQGANPVASLVHFEAGQPVKAHYRHFRIRGIQAPNDFAMMEHVVERHYRSAQAAGRTLPELVMVDGGKGQLGAAVRALERLGLGGRVTLIGLAKREEEIFRPGEAAPLLLAPTSGALKLVQRVRDEAHRFAITYHRRLRERELVRSALDDIPGVGAKTRRALLRKFGSVAAVAAASAQELAAVPGVGPVTAERVLAVLSHPALRPKIVNEGAAAARRSSASDARGAERTAEAAAGDQDASEDALAAASDLAGEGEEVDIDAAWIPEVADEGGPIGDAEPEKPLEGP